MAFEIHWLPTATATYEALETAAKSALENRRAAKRRKKSSRQEGLFKQVVKAIRLLRDNPRHPGLCSHVFSGLQNPYDPGEKVWESYVQNNTPGAYRIFWCYGPSPGWITIISITPHP